MKSRNRKLPEERKEGQLYRQITSEQGSIVKSRRLEEEYSTLKEMNFGLGKAVDNKYIPFVVTLFRKV